MEIDRSWGAVVFDNEQKFLLVQHSNGQHWSHPKGHPNPGETPFETAIREIREEGDVDVTLIDGFQMREAWNLPDGRRKEVVYYLGEKTGSVGKMKMTEAEILGRAWLSYQEALKRITYESGRRVLRGAMEFLKLQKVGKQRG